MNLDETEIDEEIEEDPEDYLESDHILKDVIYD